MVDKKSSHQLRAVEEHGREIKLRARLQVVLDTQRTTQHKKKIDEVDKEEADEHQVVCMEMFVCAFNAAAAKIRYSSTTHYPTKTNTRHATQFHRKHNHDRRRRAAAKSHKKQSEIETTKKAAAKKSKTIIKQRAKIEAATA